MKCSKLISESHLSQSYCLRSRYLYMQSPLMLPSGFNDWEFIAFLTLGYQCPVPLKDRDMAVQNMEEFGGFFPAVAYRAGMEIFESECEKSCQTDPLTSDDDNSDSSSSVHAKNFSSVKKSISLEASDSSCN